MAHIVQLKDQLLAFYWVARQRTQLTQIDHEIELVVVSFRRIRSLMCCLLDIT